MPLDNSEIPPPGIDPYIWLAGRLNNAQPGDVVYVDDSLQIKCNEGTARRVLEIKAGVTLMSGRGSYRNDGNGTFTYSSGAKLFTDYGQPGYQDWFIRLAGRNSRLSGFRISGAPDPMELLRVNCIDISDADFGVVDNCDITTPGIGINLNRSTGLVVRNCVIHGHRTIGFDDSHSFAYGICLSNEPVFLLVENNYFKDNWHAVASDGQTASGYEARGNFVDEPHGSAFDIHRNDLGADHYCCQYFYIHGNVFMNAGKPGVLLRGMPAQSCTVQRNFFVQNAVKAIYTGATDQLDFGDKVVVSSNTYNFTFPNNDFRNTLVRMLCPSLPPKA